MFDLPVDPQPKVEETSLDDGIFGMTVEENTQNVGLSGPAWTTGDMEPPEGTEDTGSWVTSVYTEEQQKRLNIDEMGRPLQNENTTEENLLNIDQTNEINLLDGGMFFGLGMETTLDDSFFEVNENETNVEAENSYAVFENHTIEEDEDEEEETVTFLSIWQEKRNKVIAERREKEKFDKEKILINAKRQIEEFYANREKQMERRKVNNREEENIKDETVWNNDWSDVGKILGDDLTKKKWQPPRKRYKKMLIELSLENGI